MDMLPNPVPWRTISTPPGGTPINPTRWIGTEIHHTVTRTAENPNDLRGIVRGIYADHVGDRGWADVFYGAFVARDGSWALGRGWEHTVSRGAARGWFTIALVGNYNVFDTTPAQDTAVKLLRRRLLALGGGHAIRGHSNRDATSCPGHHGRDLIQEMTTTNTGDDPAMERPSSPTAGTIQMVERAYQEADAKDGRNRKNDRAGRAYWHWSIDGAPTVAEALRIYNYSRFLLDLAPVEPFDDYQ